MRRFSALGAALVLVALSSAACTAQQRDPDTDSHESSASSFVFDLVAPDGPVPLGEDFPVIIEITEAGTPVEGVEVTFTVVEGAASYEAGFDTDISDESGHAVSLDLVVESAGNVTIEVATATDTTQHQITINN